MPNEYNTIDKWIYLRLASDPIIQAAVGLHPVSKVIQVYWKVAPIDATYPCVLYSLYRNSDHIGGGGRRVCVNAEYLVYAVNQSPSTGIVRPIADRIDDLLYQDQSSDDPIIIGITRKSAYEYGPVTDSNLVYCGVGGIYQCMGYAQAIDAEDHITVVNTTYINANEALVFPNYLNWYFAIDTTAGNIALTLFPAAGYNGNYTITNTGANSVTITTSGTDTINGETTYTIAAYGSITIRDYSAGKWSIVAI